MSDAQDHPEYNGEEEIPEEIDWDRRVLCSDENCIGVVGQDGRCKECGKAYGGELPEGFFQDRPQTRPAASAEAEQSIEPQPDSAAEEPAIEAAPSEPPPPSDWDDRILCSDGNCIGVIGPDGRCKECGKPYDPESSE